MLPEGNAVYRVRCPGCGKEHVLTQPLEQSFKKRCLRCAESFFIGPDMRAAPGTVAPAALSVTAARSNKKPGSDSAVAALNVSEKAQAPNGLSPGDMLLETAGPAEAATRSRGGAGAARGQRGTAAEQEPSEKTQLERAPKKSEDSDDEPPLEDGGRKRWLLIVGILSVLLLAGSAAAYFMIGKGKAASDKTVANKTTTPAKSKSSTPAKTAVTAKASLEKPPPPKVDFPKSEATSRLAPAIKLSAARLASELALQPEETRAKYEGKFLDVSGVFDKLQMTTPPAAHFAVEGPQLYCILADVKPAAQQRWLSLRPNQPFTAHCTLGKDKQLHDCELLPLAAPADDRYRGKEVEITGIVAEVGASEEQEFPTLRLERDTAGIVDIACLFHKTDEDALHKIRAGAAVTVRGSCAGRTGNEGQYLVRLDNCRVVYTTAPEAGTPRLKVVSFLREYEEDLHRALYQPPAELSGTPIPIVQLEQELAQDGLAAFRLKHQNKVLTLTGNFQQKQQPWTLVLASGQTNRNLLVHCYFTKHLFAGLGDRQSYTVRGVCTQLPNARTLRMDNCELSDSPASKDLRRVTVDFFPHKPGQSMTYEFILFPSNAKRDPVLMRQVLFQREGGLIESIITHQGTSAAGKISSDSLPPATWIANKKTKQSRLPGPVVSYRISGGFVELGQRVPRKSGDADTVWEPVLKLGAGTGEAWDWAYADLRHRYVVDRFDEHRGRPCVIIREMVTRAIDPVHPYEVLHVYARDVGEVERRESLTLTGTEKKPVSGKRLVEDEFPGPRAENFGQTKPKNSAVKMGPAKTP